MNATKYQAAIGSIIALTAGATIALTAWSEPLAAQTASTAIMAFPEFVNSLTVAPADAYVGQSGAAVENNAAFEEMRQHLVKMYSGVAVTHSFQQDNQVFDCIPINDQPGVRLQGLKTVAEPPPTPPTGLSGPMQERSLVGVTQDTDGQLDAFGNAQRCEDGTIPMRRLTLEELTRFGNLQQFFAKYPKSADRVHRQEGSISPPITFNGHAYAHAYQYVSNYGGYSQLALYRPYVRFVHAFSLSQQWYVGGSGDQLQTAEVGWQNYPVKYGSQNSVLFIYWTADNYRKTGCYNLDCTAFVQTNNKWHLGWGFSNYSVVGGPQYYVSLGFYFYQGNWWLAAGNDWVGYYPGSLYGGGQLTRNAQEIDFGGETFGTRVVDVIWWPPMGSGEFAERGWPYAAYHRQILYRDSNNNRYNPSLTPSQPSPECYTITTPTWGGSTWGTYFFFGGPGGTNC